MYSLLDIEANPRECARKYSIVQDWDRMFGFGLQQVFLKMKI